MKKRVIGSRQTIMNSLNKMAPRPRKGARFIGSPVAVPVAASLCEARTGCHCRFNQAVREILVPKLCFRWRERNRVSQTSGFPNRVWERGRQNGAKAAKRSAFHVRLFIHVYSCLFA